MWRGFFLGLGLFVVLAGTAYFTPLRQPLVHKLGSSYPTLIQELRARYEALDEREQRIVTSPQTVSDTLRVSQEMAWKEYAAQRDTLTGLIQLQSKPSLDGLLDWVTELWLWLAFLWMGFPLAGALIGRNFFGVRLGRMAARSEKNTALSEDSAAPSEPTTAPMGESTARIQKVLGRIVEEKTSNRSAARVSVSPVVENRDPEPVTTAMHFLPEVRESVRERADTPKVQSPNALIPEDPPAAPPAPKASAAEEEAPWGRLPETTEFEHLERQREEVLRCARKGMTSSEISRRLRIGQEQVDIIIRQHRERGGR